MKHLLLMNDQDLLCDEIFMVDDWSWFIVHDLLFMIYRSWSMKDERWKMNDQKLLQDEWMMNDGWFFEHLFIANAFDC